MKLVIAGGRDLNFSHHAIEDFYNIHFPAEEFEQYPERVISGGCSGVDKAAEEWANTLKAGGSVFKEFPADWETHGKAAGPIRNREMAEYGDALLLIWDGKSKGSGNMKKEMERLGKPVYEIIIRRNSGN